jgi:YbbR domain-containing protein
MNRDPGMEILDTSANTVRLNLSGSGTLIKSIRPEQVQVKLDLSKAVVGLNTFTITQADIALPPGIFLKGVQPSLVEVNLDIPIKKELPIQLDWAGKLPEHLILAEAKLDTDKIEVVGGTRILKNISTIYTKKIPLDKIKKTGTITVGLAINPASIKIAPGSKKKITVNYVVKRRHKE